MLNWRFACCTGTPKKHKHIYLSSATLLVVPSTLIQHWIDQVYQAKALTRSMHSHTTQHGSICEFAVTDLFCGDICRSTCTL